MITVVPSPDLPGSPLTPSLPGMPGAPVLPVLPVLPVVPVLPVFPVLPGAPCGPAGPGTTTEGPGTLTTVGAGLSHAANVNVSVASTEEIIKFCFMVVSFSGECDDGSETCAALNQCKFRR